MTTTLRQLNDTLKDIADRNLFINRYGFGELSEVDIDGPNSDLYPLMYVVPQGARLSENVLTYTIRIIVMDIDDTDDTKRVEILSDTLRTLTDVVKEFKNNSDDYNLDQDVDCLPFSQRFVDYTTGWWADISIITEIDNNPCNFPE